MRLKYICGGVALVAALALPALAQSGGAPAKVVTPAPMAKPDIQSAEPFDVAVARRVTVDDVKKWMEAGVKIRIIDTRSSFTGAMVKDAEQVPDAKLAEWSKDLAKDTLIVAYCT